jgi:hypothetical protein
MSRQAPQRSGDVSCGGKRALWANITIAMFAQIESSEKAS